MNCVATEDATVVARLRAAGAIIIGISNIPIFQCRMRSIIDSTAASIIRTT